MASGEALVFLNDLEKLTSNDARFPTERVYITNNIEMKTMKLWRNFFVMTAAMLSLASCSSDPQWTDPEAHEKTEQLRKQYAPLMVGTWHYENIGETQRYFERLTFQAEGTLMGMRKWQTRQLVTIDGKEQYTDWEDFELSGSFTGTWQLRYWSPEGNSGEKRNCLQLIATYDDADRNYMAYSGALTFAYADATTLRVQGYYVKDSDGWINYQRGEAEPSF